jgi:hypothetical protein
MLGERAVSRTEEARQRLGGAYAKDTGAPRRSGAHAVETRLSLVQKYVSNELLPETELIDRFLEAADHPKFARFSSQKNMRTQMATLQSVTVGNLLGALHRSRQWSPEQRKRAERAIDARMFLDRNDNRHIDYFKDVLNLAKDRNAILLAIARTRIAKSQQYINSNLSDASKF